MDQRTESIKQDIDATRDSMTDKMEQIEARVKGTVEDIKGSVEDTVENVKQAFDLRQQVDQRPWTMLGASVLAGYVLGSLGGDSPRSIESLPYYAQPNGAASAHSEYQSVGYPDRRRDDNASYLSSSPASYPVSPSSPSSPSSYPSSYPATQRRSEPGLMAGIMDQFGDELETLKGAAIVTVGNMLREMLKKNLPEFAEEFEHARKERERQNEATAGVQAARSHDPLERAVGQSRDATYQTHTAAPDPVNNSDGGRTF
jgi:ElaB/YqjD/DUF883 family membrane-anchored ribosome-binding protein